MPLWLWIVFGVSIGFIAFLYWLWNWERLEVFKMLLSSFFPLALLILAVLGSIVFGLSTPSEAAAIGGFGGFILAGIYRFIAFWREAPAGGRLGPVTWKTLKEIGVIVKDSSFLTAKTSAMVCWLFVGSGIFSAAFALLGGQELIEKWVLSLDMTPVQFMMLAQFIIFILGWPLEWTEIIIIFMPIFIPLLPHFHIDPLFFGLLVALNLQTAFLSPPVAMAAFYLKGRVAAARDAEPDLRRHDAVHGDPGDSRWFCSTCSPPSGCGCRAWCISERSAIGASSSQHGAAARLLRCFRDPTEHER